MKTFLHAWYHLKAPAMNYLQKSRILVTIKVILKTVFSLQYKSPFIKEQR